jgi:VWFA-related protein
VKRDQHLAVAFVLVLQVGLVGLAQQPTVSPSPTASVPTQTPQPSPAPNDDDVVRITSNLVQVDAVVTDRSGKPISDLRPEEIRIFEDGREQKVTHFSYVVADSQSPATSAKAGVIDKNAPPVPPVTLKVDQVRRTIALVVDDLGLSFESTHFVRRALKKFVDEQMQSGDLVAIIRTSGGIGALQQFTSDKRQLYASIERVRWYAGGRSGVSPFAPIEDRSGESEESRAASDDLNQFREDVFSVGTLGAVSYVVRGLKELPGRKSILLISDGFRIFSRDDPNRNFRTLEALRRLVDQAGRASVVIYTMNATGLQTLTMNAADNSGAMSPEQVEQQLTSRRTTAFESQEGLSYLAYETGGMAIRNNNDLSDGIKRVIDDQKGFYLIGYRPDDSTFDQRTGRRTFHKLKLKVLREGKFTVRMRNGFFGVSDTEAKAALPTAREQVLGALFSPFGAAGVHVRLTSLFSNDAKLGSVARSMLHVKAADLTFTDEPDGWHQAAFDVVAVTFGDNGNVVDQTSRTHDFRVKGQAYKNVLKDGFVYFVTFPIKKPGGYQLRAAVRDHGSQRVGSASQFIEIPDIKKNRLVLSSVVISGRSAKGKTQAGVGDTAASTQAENEELAEPTNSAAVRQFHVGTIVDYSLIVYNARLPKEGGLPQVQIQARVFRDGKPVFVGKEQVLNLNQPTDLKRLAAGGAMQLGADLTPGEYVFQVIVTDLLAEPKRRVATQWVDFEMAK